MNISEVPRSHQVFLTINSFKYFSPKYGINFQAHGTKINLLALCGVSSALGSVDREQPLAEVETTQRVEQQPGLQRILGEPVTRNFFGVDRAAQGGGIGVRTIHRGDDRSGAMPFGHPVFMPARMIHRTEGRS